ncbi:MAG: hypothetical protein OXH19_05245 [Chloroflexi bacterium]|nr:hypothetical protein [Chloroflexota bacterium]MCY3587897.1 hypothetical protein [Chloroflexota bacterium]MCY3684814.1 hypothetical protein [Chloroflexota bacterium]MDE2708644.1 hypothetical protein [Chloroflexota bacterium]
MKLLVFWRIHFLRVELAAAAVCAGIAALYLFVLSDPCIAESVVFGNRGTVYRTSATVGATLAGLVGTIVAIVFGLIDTQRLQLLRESQHRETLLRVFFSTIRSLGLLVIVSFLGLIIDHRSDPIMGMAVVFVYAALLSLFRMARSIWVLQRIVRIMALPSPSGQ